MPDPIPVLSQAAESVELEWTAGDDLNFMWWVEGVDWSGPYEAVVSDRAGAPLLTFSVTAVYDDTVTPPRTHFQLLNVDSTAVRANGWWSLTQTDINLTRFSGPARVRP